MKTSLKYAVAALLSVFLFTNCEGRDDMDGMDNRNDTEYDNNNDMGTPGDNTRVENEEDTVYTKE